MKTITAVTLCAVAAFFAAASFDAPTEAKKVKPPHVAKNFGKSVGKSVRNASKSVSRAARWSVDGIWISTGLGAGRRPHQELHLLLQALPRNEQQEVAQQI